MKGLGRRTKALIWCVLVGIVIAVMIKFELIAWLYVLASIAVIALMLIVAFADLEKVGQQSAEFGKRRE